ncbi:MAG: hypothetical protein AAF212_02020, partial [Verrucomicrobiota bacterium]
GDDKVIRSEAYTTARGTARKEADGDGFESDLMKTARDMHTARGFETDDYMSATEYSCRRSTDTFMKVSFTVLND